MDITPEQLLEKVKLLNDLEARRKAKKMPSKSWEDIELSPEDEILNRVISKGGGRNPKKK